MFCFQCEQTKGCVGCDGNAGVCGKTAETANLQDKLTGALIGLARATDTLEKSLELDKLVMEALFATLTNVNFNDEEIVALTEKVYDAKKKIAESCNVCTEPCGKGEDYDMNLLWNADEDIRSLKSLILFGVRGVAAYAYHAAVLGYIDKEHSCNSEITPIE